MKEKFIQEALTAHNRYRERHGCPPLVLSKELSNLAQRYANYLASTGTLVHSGLKYRGDQLGENLAFSYDSRLDSYSGKAQVIDKRFCLLYCFLKNVTF